MVTNLSFDDVMKAGEALGGKIRDSGFKPDCLIGIATGGLYPLALLAKELPKCPVLTISAMTEEEDDGGRRTRLTYLPAVDLKGKDVLLIDEIAQTGGSLKSISEEVLARYSPAAVRTATFAINADLCRFLPDYYVLVEKGDWLRFPWERESFDPYPVKM